MTVTANNPVEPVDGGVISFAANPAVNGASATLSASSAVIAGGQAKVTATANTVAGSYTVTASAAGAPTAAFSLTNTPGAAASVAVVSGSGQSATVGAPFANPLVVVVKDTYGNPVPGTSVAFAAPTSGASATLMGSPATTGADGQASVTATANTTAGSYTVTASVVGVTTSAAFNLTNTKDATTTTINASPTSPSFGQAVTFTATVTANAPGSGTPTGSVDFVDTTTGNDLGSAALSGGTAMLPISSLTPGSHTILAKYQGDTNFLASSSTQNATVTVGASLIVLNSSASGALQVTGTSTINVTGPVYVDSNSSSALVASGSGQVKAAGAGIQVVGGVSVTGGASLSPTPVTDAPAVLDPLAGLPVPPTGTSSGSVNLSSSSTLTINPGVYSKISVTGNAHLTLNRGVYVIAGGGFTVGNSALVTGSGVLIYNAGSNYPNPGGSFGAINFSGTSKVLLSAATSGPYAGIVLFQSRDNAQTMSLGNSSVQTLKGVVYVPAALVSVSGTDQLSETSLVADRVLVQGSSGATSQNMT